MQKNTINIKDWSYLELLELRVQLANAISDHEQKALESLNEGLPVIGFRLKKGRKVRKIANEPTLVESFNKKFPAIPKADLYTRKLIGIPAIEKLLTKAEVSKDQIALFLSGHITTDFSATSLEYVGV